MLSAQIGAHGLYQVRLTRCCPYIRPAQAAGRASVACELRCSTEDAVRTARVPCLAARVQPPLYALPGVQAGAEWASARGVQPGEMSMPPFTHMLSLASALCSIRHTLLWYRAVHRKGCASRARSVVTLCETDRIYTVEVNFAL